MVDNLTPPAPGSDDTPKTVHPAGVVQGVLTDVIDLGDKVDTFPGSPEKLVRKLALVYQSSEINPDTDRPFELSYECSLSWGEKANLRKWLGNMRGKPFSDAEIKNPPNLASFVGANALLTVVHQTSAKGRTYAKLANVAPLMKGMPTIQPTAGYQRAKFWETRKEEYRVAAAAFTKAQHREPDYAEKPKALADEGPDDLPF